MVDKLPEKNKKAELDLKQKQCVLLLYTFTPLQDTREKKEGKRK